MRRLDYEQHPKIYYGSSSEITEIIYLDKEKKKAQEGWA